MNEIAILKGILIVLVIIIGGLILLIIWYKDIKKLKKNKAVQQKRENTEEKKVEIIKHPKKEVPTQDKSTKEKKSSFNIFLVVILVLLVVTGVIFVVPIPCDKKELYTEVVKYEAPTTYQETVNYDDCDSSSGCVCTKHGGLLWLTCKQCSCTRHTTEVREKLVLKERTVRGTTTLFKSWTHSVISESDAKNIAKQFLDFYSSKSKTYVSISGLNKEDGIWEISFNDGRQSAAISISADTGKILEMESQGVKYSFDRLLQMVNN